MYKSFMSGHLRRKFLALPHDFKECRCKCENGAEDCSTSNLSCCTNGVSTDSDNVRLFYDLSKRLALPNRIRAVTYELVECSGSCKCGPDCPNRVTQRGRQVAVVIFFENANKNWGLRAGEFIRRGQYIAEYVGEVKLASSFEKDADETYQFQIPGCFEFDGKEDSLIIDASHFGSEARFINHSCTPNALPVWVYSDDYGDHYARSCFFAIRDIQAGEEITFNYYSGIDLKKKMKNGVKCRCSPKCKNYIPDRTQQQSDAQAMSSPEKAERSREEEKNKRKSMVNPSQNSSSNNGNRTFGGSPLNRLLTTQQDRIQQSAKLQQFERQARANRRSSLT
ncbi:hypothetical protein WR25_19507 [Diploscapter pachys]|uniref:Histone-lysine N-methyltransferase n=1 Tax=Diploscapter pachys TaxID=2018661 RepID=A0A2A2K0K4_9BILA|nr:hypothetical protein WR25_19507 [Diploscapter pachys]